MIQVDPNNRPDITVVYSVAGRQLGSLSTPSSDLGASITE
jgi:hypothetical protein